MLPKCSISLKYIFSSLLFLLILSFQVAAQDEVMHTPLPPARLAQASEEMNIKQFVSKLTAVLSTENREALSEFFLLGDRAYQYAAHVYQGTEIGQYEFQLKGVVDFYRSQSLEALDYFSSIDPQITSTEVHDIKVREGATEHMTVYVVRLNVFPVEAAAFSFRVNMVETQDGWVILNLKN
jgi:hypothetical protein